MMTKVFALVNKTNIGDNGNARGTAREIAVKLETTFSDVDIDNINDVTSILSADELSTVIIVSAGAHMIDALHTLKNSLSDAQKARLMISWASHQLPDSDKLQKIKEAADVIALPVHSLNDHDREQLGDKLVTTIGVAHAKTKDTVFQNAMLLKNIYNDLPDSDNYVLVSLAGDAPDSDGKIKFYTEAEATKLGELVAQYALEHKAYVLAINGPRTGKYNPENSQENKQYHQADSSEMDPASKAFVSALGETPNTFVNFIFGNTFKNPYDLFLHKVQSTSSIALVGGESTSQVSEMCDILGSKNVLVYMTESMNPTHTAHVNSVIHDHLATVFSPKEVELLPQLSFHNEVELHKTAAEVIAEAVLHHIY